MRLVVVLWLGACGRVGFDPAADGVAVPVPCDDPFGEPAVLLTDFKSPSVTDDELELFVTAPGGELAVATRTSRDEPFGDPVVLPDPPNSTIAQSHPSISADGLELYFTGSLGGQAPVLMSRRANRSSLFETPIHAGPFGEGDVSRSRLHHYNHDLGTQIRLSTRDSVDDAFVLEGGLPAVINDGSVNAAASISSDERELYFISNRSGGSRIWVATRDSVDVPFDRVTMLEVPGSDDPEISADGHHLYFTSNLVGGTPVVQVAGRCD